MAIDSNPVHPGHPCDQRTMARPGFREGMPELLAPAGDWGCAKAAVENGADAIYFGLDKFNARMRAHNFTEADLPELMEFLHRRGVRGYVTLNTLLFEDELAPAEQYLKTTIRAGVDAVIVQDIGLCRLIRALSPDFPIHASTQMTVTSVEGVNFARELGCQLVVLARELSINEIGQIRSAIHNSRSAVPLEVFVHGALCVAYSGQCLTSESLGGRSANRGECAQACRMPYDLICDGQPVPLGERRYLLSPQDLAGIDLLPQLVRAGIASLKIEGRLKTPEYVANITRIYREALDHLASVHTPQSPFPIPRYEMEMAFSRGLHTGWLDGVDNQNLVHARFGKKRGVYLGEVTAVHSARVTVRLEGPLKPGDGVVFDAGRPEDKEEGGRVFEMGNAERGARSGTPAGRGNATSDTQNVVLTFRNEAIDFGRIHIGDKLWKTSDPTLENRWRRSFEGSAPRSRRAIQIEVHGIAGNPLTAIARDDQGHVAKADSAVCLTNAEKQPLTKDRLRQQLGRLGGTPFILARLINHLEGDLMLPVSELNRLRRQLIDELDAQRRRPKRWTLSAEQSSGVSPARMLQLAGNSPNNPLSPADGRVDVNLHRPRPGRDIRCDGDSVAVGEHGRNAGPHLIILVRSLAQLGAALRAGAQTVYCDFENPRKYRDAVTIFRDWQLTAQAGCNAEGPAIASPHSAIDTPQSAIYVAPPRIFKPGEQWQLEQVRSCHADGYLVRNYDHLQFFAQDHCVGDFSLNVANHLSAEYFVTRFGLKRVTASYDLNFPQLEALLLSAPPAWFEITIHQHMPMFHMEHCVFCAFLSTGKDYRDCGRPCDKHSVTLRDRVGAEHPVLADVGCRNTVFNALAQTGAEYVKRMLALGARHFRIEFLKETPLEVERTITNYRQLFRGEITGTQLWRELKVSSQLGVTRGQMAGAGRGA